MLTGHRSGEQPCYSFEKIFDIVRSVFIAATRQMYDENKSHARISILPSQHFDFNYGPRNVEPTIFLLVGRHFKNGSKKPAIPHYPLAFEDVTSILSVSLTARPRRHCT